MPTRPASYLNWIPSNNPAFISTPTGAQLATGWTSNERPPFQYMNWVFNLTDQWIQWFDSLNFASVGAIDSVTPSANGLVISSGVLFAQSASASNPGMVNTIAQTFAGNKSFNGQVSIGGVLSSNALLEIGLSSNTLSLSSQYASQATIAFNSACTVQGIGYLSSINTAASSFTLPLMAGFYSTNNTKGAGSVITRQAGYFVEQPTQGSTGNAAFADNNAYTGNFFINQTGFIPSLFTGNVTFAGDMIPNGISASSANAIRLAQTLSVINGSTFSVPSGNVAISHTGDAGVSTYPSSSFVGVTNCAIGNFVSNGNPVEIKVMSDGTNNGSYIGGNAAAAPVSVQFRLIRDITLTLGQINLLSQTTDEEWGPTNLQWLDTNCPAGTHQYVLQVSNQSGSNNAFVSHCILVAKQIV